MSFSPSSSTSRVLPIVLILFAASGCAALIYEIAWFQMLQLIIGSTAISLGVLLATFMGGLCLGSFLLPRLKNDFGHPLKLYGFIELGIALCGLLVLFGLPLIDGVYVAGVQSGMAGMLMRGVLASVCLLAPTFLMGASLPAISRFIEATPKGVEWWGWLYTGNTIGAVSGCLFASFYLLRLHDTGVATYAAMAINIVAGIGSLALAARTPVTTAVESAKQDAAPVLHNTDAGGRWPIYLTIALSGATALGAEVVWTRLLGMMFGATVYAFSIILAVFLVGLGIGSGVGSALLKSYRPRVALGWAQLCLAGGIAWAAYMINSVLPYQAAGLSLNPWEVALADIGRATLALFPATLLWGISFPLAMAAAARAGDAHDSAKPVSAVYAANTFGGIIGALSVSLILIITIGVQNTQRLMLVLAVISGLILLIPAVGRSRSPFQAIGVFAMLALAVLLTWVLPQQPGNLVAYGRFMPGFYARSTVLEQVEGRNSGVVITRFDDGQIQISVGGHVEATTEPYDMRLQRMVGHLPGLLHPNPKKVLGIGFGAGVSAGSLTRYNSITSITICEIEPAVPPISTKYFAKFDNNVKNDPRTTIVYDDARHFMLTTTEKYDIIASDPLDVWVKGTASIYSYDYFEMVKKHLNPGGYFTLYVPLYETSVETLRSELATFFKAFPNGTIWANTIDGVGYDLVLMGQADPLKIDIDKVEARMKTPEFAKVAESMQEIGFGSASEMYATYSGKEADMRKWLDGAQINTDRNLRLMYLAGWGFNSQLGDELQRTIYGLRTPPGDMFTGSPESLERLNRMMMPIEQQGG